MLNKVSHLPMSAYIMMTGAFKAFFKDERGLSGVVVAILLILVAVLAIVLIWGFLSGWLRDLWDQITSQADTIT